MRKTWYATGSASSATRSNTTRRGRTSTNHATTNKTIIRPRSGRTSGARPSTIAKPARLRPSMFPARATDTRTYHEAASHNHTRPISSPEVAKSQTTATDATRIIPTGTTAPPSPRCRRRVALPATMNAATAAMRLARSVIHSMLANAPNTSRPTTRTASHTVLVAASTRSPALNTGPCPAKI